MTPALVETRRRERKPTPSLRPRAGTRGLFVWLHRYAGLVIAFFLMIAGVTGIALAFYQELDRALNPELYEITERTEPALSADALAQSVQKTYPEAFINLMTLDRKPGQSVRVRLSPHIDPATGQPFVLRWTEIFLDPFDGKILGGRDRGAWQANRAHLMPFLYRVHYTLYIPGYWGEWFMGIVALVWLFDCFVGFYVTLPARTPSTRGKNFWQRWKSAWRIKRGASATRFNFDLHRAGGLWLWGILLMLALTSVYFNLTREVFRPVLSVFAALSPETTPTLQQLPQATRPVTLSFDDAIRRAFTLRSENARTMTPSYVGLTPDAPGIYRVRFADIDRGDANWHFHYENLFIDGVTGELALRVGYDTGTAADKFLLWQYPLHSGQIFGLWGRVGIAFMGIFVVILSITGIIVWIKKRRARMA
jgi:uncharacterized iron-regulated membrane protein